MLFVLKEMVIPYYIKPPINLHEIEDYIAYVQDYVYGSIERLCGDGELCTEHEREARGKESREIIKKWKGGL